MEHVTLWAKQLAQASGESPLTVMLAMFFIYTTFNSIESMIERLLFGKSFLHWLDPLFLTIFLLFTLLSISYCKPKK